MEKLACQILHHEIFATCPGVALLHPSDFVAKFFIEWPGLKFQRIEQGKFTAAGNRRCLQLLQQAGTDMLAAQVCADPDIFYQQPVTESAGRCACQHFFMRVFQQHRQRFFCFTSQCSTLNSLILSLISSNNAFEAESMTLNSIRKYLVNSMINSAGPKQALAQPSDKRNIQPV